MYNEYYRLTFVSFESLLVMFKWYLKNFMIIENATKIHFIT